MGDDDMFSSDLSEDQLRQRLGHMSTTQCQVLSLSTCDFVNTHGNTTFFGHSQSPELVVNIAFTFSLSFCSYDYEYRD